MASIGLQGFDASSPLLQALRRELSLQVPLVVEGSNAALVLYALLDQRERVAVATTATAQVRELQLRLRFSFRASTPAGRELIAPTELVVVRDLSYREAAALAKEYEQAEMFRDMQADIVAQVMRRLAAVVL